MTEEGLKKKEIYEPRKPRRPRSPKRKRKKVLERSQKSSSEFEEEKQSSVEHLKVWTMGRTIQE
jgi:hypothetical protein